jgi:hypothetical protein
MEPRHGDVLVSRVAARIEHEVSIVPAAAEIVCPNHEVAIARARELAQARQVDAWLTEDNIHTVKIASYRTGAREPG